MRIHKRGIRSPWFEHVKEGRKKFEIRREVDGHDFWVGDTLLLIHEETHERISCKIIYRYNGDIGLQPGFVILGIEVIDNGSSEEKEKEKGSDAAVDDKGQTTLVGVSNVLVSQQAGERLDGGSK